MNAPRPRDFLQAELARLQDLRRNAHRRHDDRVTVRAVRAAYDRRIDALLDELADIDRGPLNVQQ